MKNKKFLFISLLILAIGFASVSTILYITGTLVVQTNADNFDVYFSGAILDGEDKTNMFVKDKKHIVYKTNDLMKAGDISELEYEVTNGSNQYDADVEITCTPTITEYYTVTTVPNSLTVEARKVESGKIKVELIKYSTEIIEETIECELVANAVERTSTGDNVAIVGDYAIEGILKDKDGDILPKTNIVVYSENPHEVKTDRYGYFYVSGLEKGLHEIYLKTDEDINDKEATKEASSFGATITTNNVYKVTKGDYQIDSHNAGLELVDKSNYCEYDEGYKWNFNYTASQQIFKTPCTGIYKMELWGAQGGGNSYGGVGGKGGYVSGNIEIEENNQFYVYVGGAGGVARNGYNGGGSWGGEDGRSPGGGGATDIRIISNNLYSRIMVAGGGGGGGINNTGAAGGIGAVKNGNLYGGNGTQTSGGTAGIGYTHYSGQTAGTFGSGGTGGWYVVGAGGGGWYGGGGGAHITPSTSGGGGGGSSYVKGCSGCSTAYLSSQGNYTINNPQMIAGNSSMPNTTGTGNESGHAGNGYVKITLIELT